MLVCRSSLWGKQVSSYCRQNYHHPPLGCGKTSLIRFAALLRGVDLFILNIHAGRTEEEIAEFIQDCETKANGLQTWIFLDEINACNHLGFINRLICHRKLHGVAIARNIVFLAACNPYRLKKETTTTAG